MTQRRVENTRVHIWTFSPVSVNAETVHIWTDFGTKKIQILILITVPTAFSGTAFSGHSSFSGHIFAPLKNPLIEELKDFGKICEIFFKLRSNRFCSLFLSENLLLNAEFAKFWVIYAPSFLELYLLHQYKIDSLVEIKNLVKNTS